ncbi:unnamed protein product, partial [Symbiodinium pilosum]
MVLWMQRTKLKGPPFRAGDVVDFLFMLAEEPCGHTVPGSVLKALSWFEKAADLAPEHRATAGRLVWSTREVLARSLSRPDRPVKRAPRLPGAMIVSLEILTVNHRESLGVRVGSFYRLLKCWGTLRHDDVQRICPQRVRFFSGRFTVTLSISKTSGPDRRQVELPIAITEDSWLYERDWLQVGWRLLMDAAPFDRDYLIPALRPDFGAFRRRIASYSEISAMSAAVTRRLVTLEGSRLVPDGLVELWTEHSERATLPTLLDGFGLDPRDRDALGRWRPEGSDTYMRSFSAKFKRIHRYLKSELEKQRLEGELDDHDVLEAAYDWLRARRSMEDDAARQIDDDFRSALRTWRVQDADSPVSDEEQADDEQSDDTEPEASRAAMLGNNLADFSFAAAEAALNLPVAFMLLEQPEDLGTVRPKQRPSSMWQRKGFQRLRRRARARHIAFHQRDFGVDYAKPTRILLRSSVSLPPFMYEQLPSFDADGYYTGPLPRHPDAPPMRSEPGKAFITTGTATWPSDMCRWVAEAILHDFLALVNVAGEGDKKTSQPRQIGPDGTITFNFNSADIRNVPEDPGMAESIALACLVRGQATAEDLKALSDALPDEIRVREADKPRKDQKSFTTGAYIHGDQEQLCWTCRPHDNLLLACSSFENGGLWTEAKGGVAPRIIRGHKVEGEILSWKDGKISFDAHRWHATEDWSGFRLVLAGYTVAELGSLSAGDCSLLQGVGFCLSETRTSAAVVFPQVVEVDPTHPPVPGGEGRWDPSHRLYCEGAGWRELRTKLEEIVMNHAGGPILFDRVVFEMATKGEAGCNLVSSPLPRTPEVYEEQTTWKLEMGPNDVAKAWKANYESAAEHIGYVREHFDAEVAEGLMLKLDEDTFWRRYGDEAALSAIAVLVDEGIRCLDKVRSPGAREKRYLLRFLKEHQCAALSVTGDISKAHRRFRHSPDEWGYLGCKASDADAYVYVNCVGTFGVASAGYWWSRISGGGRWRPCGTVISYASLAALGFPFKWAKTCGGFVVEWVGFETAYFSFTGRVADPLVHGGRHVGAGYMVRLLVRIGEAWLWGKRVVLGAAVSWATVLMVGSYTRQAWPPHDSGDDQGDPQASGKSELTFFSDAKAENGRAYVGGYLWNGTIASLELLGTLICVKLWGSRMSGRSRSAGSIAGATDNQGNTYAVAKLMSTKYPLPILLMELSETLRLGSVFLDLRWVPRERNQWADDLTNGEFGHVPMDRRQELDAHAMQWHVLGRLLDVAQTFHDEMVAEKEAAKQGRGGGHVSSGTVRKAKR